MSAANPDPTAVKVSVAMITYNHEAYIAQAIESVLMQQTDFKVELVIGEDCSTDDTRAIVCDYGTRYPERIHLLLPELNQGAHKNFDATLKACRGDYVAILEGDDYWTDPLKLQKQSEFLDANPGYAIVFTRSEAFFQDEDRPSYVIPGTGSEPYNLEGLLRNNFIANCSVMYRKKLVKEYPHWLSQLDMGDWPLHVLYAQHGKIGFIGETMAKYRIHAKSNFSSRNVVQNHKSILAFFRVINPYLGFQHDKVIYRSQAEICKAITRLSLPERHWGDAIHYTWLGWLYFILGRLK